MKLWIKIDRPMDAEADLPLRDEAPIKIKQLYHSGHHQDELIFWLDDDENTMGCIKNNRSISISCAQASALELQEMKPAKGGGYVALAFMTRDNQQLGSIYANRHSQQSADWLKSIQTIIVNAIGLESRHVDQVTMPRGKLLFRG